MRCARCKKPISKVDEKKVHVERDEEGRLKAAYHNKCHFVMLKQARMGGTHERGRYYQESPTAYDMRQGGGRQNRDDLTPEEQDRRAKAEAEYLVLAERRKEIAEQRALEERPERFDDVRDPETMDVDEILEATEQLKREIVGGS